MEAQFGLSAKLDSSTFSKLIDTILLPHPVTLEEQKKFAFFVISSIFWIMSEDFQLLKDLSIFADHESKIFQAFGDHNSTKES
jgi:hypothetical protein